MPPEFKSVKEMNDWLKSNKPQRDAFHAEIQKILAEYQRNPNSEAKVVIIGSFRYKSQIDDLIERLEREGIEVLAPPRGPVTDVDSTFAFPLIEIDQGRDPLEVEDDFMRSLAQADVVYIVNPGGYAGNTSASEWGYIWGHKPIFLMEPLYWPDEEGHPTYEMLRLTTPVVGVDALIDMIKKREI